MAMRWDMPCHYNFPIILIGTNLTVFILPTFALLHKTVSHRERHHTSNTYYCKTKKEWGKILEMRKCIGIKSLRKDFTQQNLIIQWKESVSRHWKKLKWVSQFYYFGFFSLYSQKLPFSEFLWYCKELKVAGSVAAIFRKDRACEADPELAAGILNVQRDATTP